MNGKTVEAYVHEEITYADIHNNTDSFEKMEKAAEEALLQIDEKKYDHDLKSEGYEIANTFAVVFCKKRCLFKGK